MRTRDFARGRQRRAARGAQRLPLGHLAHQPVDARQQVELLQHREDPAVADHHRRYIDAHVEIRKACEQRPRVTLDRL